MTRLCELAEKFSTDKRPAGHNYTPFYNFLFEDLKPKTVLEIGVANGASLKMWEEYFPEANIFGADIDTGSQLNCGRIKTMICNQGVESDLVKLYEMTGPVDIVIEDASHKSQDQIFTAIIFSRYLTDGGYYIIEDVQESARFEVFKVIQDALYPKFQVSQTEMKNGSGDDSRLVVIRKK